jgi:hypothetical protein
MTDFDEFAARIAGPVLIPADAGYGEEVAGFNLAMVHRPDVVVGATSAADVVEAVQFARELGIPVRVQSTGHGSLYPIRGGLLITTKRLDAVTLDASARTATFGGGVRWSAIIAAAAAHGLAPIAGSSPTVGAIGYLLGGGLGPLNRSHGCSSDYLRSATLVTGAGELVEASAESNPDLFWAIRGGKGGLGIVVEATLELVELPTLYGGSLFFEIEHGPAVLGGWLDWTRTARDDISTSLAIIRFPDLDLVPPPMRGRHLLSLRFAYPGPTPEGADLAAPLRALAPVHLDALGELPASEIARVHNDPTDPMMSWVRGFAVSGPDRGFAASFLGAVGAHTSVPFTVVELRHLGGATRTDVADGSAVGARDAEFAVTIIGAPDPALFEKVLPGAVAELRGMLAPWLSESVPINWIAEPWIPEQYASAWNTPTRARLTQVRAAYDPDHVFPYGPPRH